MQLVVEDVNKLKYEMAYYDEMTREERSFNNYIRHFNRRSVHNSSVSASICSFPPPPPPGGAWGQG